MVTIIACLIAFISTIAFLLLWCCDVRRKLKAKRDMVKSAELQLIACRKYHKQAIDVSEKQDSKSVLARSEDIYRQSVALYNQAMNKPPNFIPGFFMGFRKIKERDDL